MSGCALSAIRPLPGITRQLRVMIAERDDRLAHRLTGLMTLAGHHQQVGLPHPAAVRDGREAGRHDDQAQGHAL